MKELIKEVYRENRVSKKTGNAYQVIVIVFENGYHLETFLNNEQQYILANIPVRQESGEIEKGERGYETK